MRLCLLFLLCFLPIAVFASESKWYSYERGIFHITFQIDGDNAVPIKDDNDNSIPDRIEDIATQLSAARELFHDILHFPDPLISDRYRGKARGIEVIVKSRQSMGRNGGAFSKVTASRFDRRVLTLKIHVANTVDPRNNATPEHEYFHLIQYGNSYFMNGWYLEGTARWSQDAISRVTSRRKPDEVGLFDSSYDAAKKYWDPMAASAGSVLIPKKLMRKYRYVDKSPVFKDNLINGPEAIRNLLHCLHEIEPEAVRLFGGNVQNWRKNGQRSKTNNELIFQCARKCQKKRGSSNGRVE